MAFVFLALQETKDEDLERLVQAHCYLDLTAPMPGCTDNQRRHLLYEGDLKLREGSTKVKAKGYIKWPLFLLDLKPCFPDGCSCVLVQ